MQEQIKEIRVQLDGLAQLTKELGAIIRADMKNIPDGLSPEEYMERLKLSKGAISGTVIKLSSKETNKAYDSLILAKAWLGKVLEELGSETPYANDGNRKEVSDIEPAADKADMYKNVQGGSQVPSASGELVLNFHKKTHIEKVDWLREEIKNLIENKLLVLNGPPSTTRELAIARTNSYNHLCEARFWLGFELGRIRDESGK